MRFHGLLVVTVLAWHSASAQQALSPASQTPTYALATAAPSNVNNHTATNGSATNKDPVDPVDVDTTLYGAPALYELRLAHVASMTVKVYDARRDLFIPLDQFCHLAELPYDVDLSHHGARLGTFKIHWTPTEVVMVRDTLYVSLAALDRVTHATAEVDRNDASITLSNITTFPITQRAARSAARDKLLRDTDLAMRDTTGPVLPNPDNGWGGFSLDYAFLGHNTWTSAAQGYSLSATTMVAGGSLVMNAAGQGIGASQAGASWLGAWPSGHTVAQLRVGDGTASGLGALWSRGLFISNAPLVPPQTVAVIPLNGTLPSDWSIDAYRDGALIAFDSVGPNGHYHLAVPLQYGDNPFDLVAYGPSGEMQQLAYVFHALPTLLPPHVFQYAASTGACISASCAWTSNADVQYGLSTHWSIRSGMTQYVWRDQTSTLHPYIGITAMPRPGIGVEAEAMDNAYRSASIRLDPSPTVSLVGDYTTYENSRAGIANTGGTWRNTFSMYGSIAAGPKRPEFDIQALHTVDQFGVQAFERIGSAVNLSGATLRPYVRIVQSTLQSNQSFLGTDMLLMPASWGMSPLKNWLLHSTLETTTHGGWSETQVILSRVDSHLLHIEGGMLWQRQFSKPQFTFSLVTDLGAMRSTTTVTAIQGTTPIVQQSTSGSLRWDATLQQFIRSPDPSLDRSGVSGVVFLDTNGNGQLDPGEHTLANVHVRVDNTIVTTDDQGHYDMLGVVPTEIATVSVDTATLESPWWAPTVGKLRVRTLPNHVVSVNIPIMITGIAEGRVVTATGDGLQVPLILTNLTTGQHRTIDTFSDGGFYQMGLAPGRYIAQIDPTTLAALHMTATPTQFTITGESTTQNLQLVAH